MNFFDNRPPQLSWNTLGTFGHPFGQLEKYRKSDNWKSIKNQDACRVQDGPKIVETYAERPHCFL